MTPGEAAPRRYGQAVCRGAIRVQADDFAVDEELTFEPSGNGEHLYLLIEKRGANTQHVAGELASQFGVSPVDVGFAGRKDRHALTRQWFSVRTAQDDPVGGAQWQCIEQRRHAKKLRTGQVARNHFRLRLRELDGPRDGVEQRLEVLDRDGAPNYFGPQRFGRDGANLERAWTWLSAERRPRVSVFRKGMHLSVARAHLFNAVLGARVAAGNFAIEVPGDVLTNGVPTGPLWGRGRSETSGEALTIERAALAQHEQWLAPLEHVGLTQARRPLVMKPGGLRWHWFDRDDLELSFHLAAGQYATSLIRELGEFEDRH